MKILILRLSSIGDILLTTPFIRQTRREYPEAQIEFVVKKQFRGLVENNPHIDKLHSLDTSKNSAALKTLRSDIRGINFDIIIDLHNNLRTSYLLKNIPSGQVYRIKKNKIKRALLVYTKINLYDKILPIPLRYLDVGRQAGIEDDGGGLELFIDAASYEKTDAVLSDHHVKPPYLVIAAGAGFRTKQYPLNYLDKVIGILQKEIDHHFVIVGSERERRNFDFLEKHKQVVNLAGEFNLLQTGAVISNAEAVMANDSGIMHMATALSIPVLAIFGSTVEELGFFPFRGKSKVVENQGLWCRPCSHVGRNSCPLGHFRCMKELHPEIIAQELKLFMDNV